MTEEKLLEIKKIKNDLDSYNCIVSELEYADKYHSYNVVSFIEILKKYSTYITKENSQTIIRVLKADMIEMRNKTQKEFDNI